MEVSTNRTDEFKQALRQKQASYPPAKRLKTDSNPTSSTKDDAWTQQAEQLASNLRGFTTFLASIRRAYLDLGSSSSLHSHRERETRQLDPSKGLKGWEGVKWLSEREKDEIDFGVKVAVRQCVDRVRELELAEKERVATEARLQPGTSLTRLLGLASPELSTSENLAAHRSFITLYLNTLLASVSAAQTTQQEARLKRQLERGESLGGSGGGGAQGMEKHGKTLAERARADYAIGLGTTTVVSDGKGKGKAVGEVPLLYRPAPLPDDEADDPAEPQLTPAQIQQFEAEESAMLKAAQSDLAALRSAESSLLEIASLQSQLVAHLSQQSELTDKLWEDAVAVSGKVEEGNQQLVKARERNKDSRIFLLIFLFGASFSLLFLDYYS